MSSTFVFSVYLGLIALFFDQTDGFHNVPVLRYSILKSVPIFALSLFVYLEYTSLRGLHRSSHALGLFFSACGDFVISLHDDALPFAAILFAVGHIMYMAVFATRLRRLSTELVVPSLFFALVMNHFFLIPQLPHSPLATLVLMAYSLILCSAVVVSGSLYFHGTKHFELPKHKSEKFLFFGYFVFFVSDSLLLLNHSGHQMPYPAMMILFTYYTAQFFILLGAAAAHDRLLPAVAKPSVCSNNLVQSSETICCK